jgi:hypothetical protein
VELVGVARIGLHFFPDPLDGVRVQPAQIACLHRQPPSKRHRPAAALLQGRVVQVGERPAVEDLVGQDGRLHRIPGHHFHLARVDVVEQRAQAVHVHRLAQTVLERLVHQWMVRDLHGPGCHILLTRRQRREHGRHEVVGFHALDGRRVLSPAPHPQHRQSPVQVPSPPRGEHRRGQHGLAEHVLHRLRRQELRHPLQRKAVLWTERQQDGVVAGRGLELEVEGHAEALAQGQPQTAVQPGPERRVPHKLHPPAFVEEPLEDQLVFRGDHAQSDEPGPQIAHDRVGGGPVDAAFLLQPLPRAVGILSLEPFGHGGTEI